MAVLKDLIVHGASRFLNGINTDSIHANLIDANDGVFKTITTTTLDAETITTEMLKATNARVSQTLTVDGTISTNKWEAANIANIGGNFYISPTGKSDSGTITVTKTGTTTINGVTVGIYKLVVGSASFGVTSTNSTIWGPTSNNQSKVIFTGSISYSNSKKFPLGTCNGTMTTLSTGTNILTGFTITGVTSAALDVFLKEVGITVALNTDYSCSGYELQISVYQSYSNSNLRPVGILLTSYGKEKRQYIDIYGGTNVLGDTASGFADPEVRIGQLDGLPALYTGQSPSGWGIYTTNGFFKGKIVATLGKIGDGTAAWTIGNDGNNRAYIYSGITNITSSGSTTGIYVGTNGISNYQSASQYVNLSSGKITAQGADIQGVLKADTGRIGGSSGWTIAAQQISSGSLGSDSSMFLSTKNLSGTVGGKTFGSSDAAWRFTVGSHFGVDKTGALYCDTAIITGAITASALTINAGATIGGDGAKPILNSTFLKVDGNGLMLYDGSSSESTSSTVSTNNLLITPSEIQIRDGQNVLAKYGSAVTIGNDEDELDSSYIYIDNNDFIVFDSRHSKAFSVSSDGALLTLEKLRTKGLSISTRSESKTNPNGQTKTISLSGYNIPTDNASNTTFRYTLFAILNNNNTIGENITVSLQDIKNAGSSGYTPVTHRLVYEEGGRVTFTYTQTGSIERLIVTTSITGTKISRIFININSCSYTETTESLTPYCSIGSRKEDTTLGAYSITGGYNNEASGNYSQSFGCDTISQGAYQTVIGKYNTAQGSNSIANTDYAFIIGNGTSNTARSNALTVDWNGTITANGYICNNIGGNSSTTHASVLSTWFANHKSSISRNTVLSYWSNSYGNGSQYIGYFLNGYDTTPYGGFFVCHYGTPRYVGISNGTYTQYELTKTATSSRKTKENIKLMTEKEAKKLYDLNVISFDYKKGYEEGKKNQFGLIAEDCDKIIPYVVNKPNDNEDSIWGIDYVKFVPYLIKNLQLHEETIEKLNNTVQQLMDRVDKLESEIKALKSQ